MNTTKVNVLVALGAMASMLISGCAVQRVRVNAYLSHDLDFPVPGGEPVPSMAVIVGSEPKEPLLEAEVARKVAHLVRQAGFQTGTPEDADYVLTAWVSIDKGAVETVVDSGYYGPVVSGGYVCTYPGRWSGVSIGIGGGYGPRIYDYVYFKRFLGLTLYDRARWAQASDEQVGQAAAWTCTATSRGSSTDLRLIVNYLLVAAFDHFGLDTGREVEVKFERDNPAVQAIMAVGAGRAYPDRRDDEN